MTTTYRTGLKPPYIVSIVASFAEMVNRNIAYNVFQKENGKNHFLNHFWCVNSIF
jgi:hypothetical protein